MLRCVPRVADRALLPFEIERAVKRTIDEGLRLEWRAALNADLRAASQDLFADQQMEVLRRYQLTAADPRERRLCELAQGLYARDGGRPGLYDQAFDALVHELRRNNVEHLTAETRRVHGPDQARQLRVVLEIACESPVIEPARNRRQESVESLLDRPLETPIR